MEEYSDIQNPVKSKRWFKRPWPWVVVAAVLVAALISWWSNSPALPNSKASGGFTVAPGASSKASAVVDVVTADDPSRGPQAAPVVIVEFGDFQCPFCREAVPILDQLERQYPETIRLIFRDFPVISLHPEAVNAAAAANCAAQQGKFWEYHEALYAQQENLGQALYTRIAQGLGLNVSLWSSCLGSPQTLSEIQDDLAAGIQAGVRGTPTFFVNGRKLEGAFPLDVWVKIIATVVQEKFRQSTP